VDGVGIIVGIDRFLSEARAVTNFAGDAVATVLAGSWTRTIDREQVDAVLAASGPSTRPRCSTSTTTSWFTRTRFRPWPAAPRGSAHLAPALRPGQARRVGHGPLSPAASHQPARTGGQRRSLR